MNHLLINLKKNFMSKLPFTDKLFFEIINFSKLGFFERKLFIPFEVRFSQLEILIPLRL